MLAEAVLDNTALKDLLGEIVTLAAKQTAVAHLQETYERAAGVSGDWMLPDHDA